MTSLLVPSLIIASALSWILCAEGQEPKPFPHVPITISAEARQFLRQATPSHPRPKTLEEWETLQKNAEDSGKRMNEQIVREFVKTIDKVRIAGVEVHIVTPKSWKPKNQGKVLVHVHGGGYVVASAESTYHLCVPVAARTGLKVYSIDYRLAPQYPFPAGLRDCVSVYREMVRTIEPQDIGVFGHSSGGALLIAMLLKANDEDLPMPGAVVSWSPWADLSKTGDTYYTLEGVAPELHYDWLAPMAKAYAGRENMKHPLVSPVYATYPEDFPPTLIQTGTRDMFLSNCARLYRKMKTAGVDVEMSVWEGIWHGVHVVPDTGVPEVEKVNREVADFFAEHLSLDKRSMSNPGAPGRKLPCGNSPIVR